MIAWEVMLVGALAAAACALPGTFLVLRGMSLVGDAISHAVLPGIVLAFLITNSSSALPVVIGTGLFGLFTVFLIETVRRSRRVKEDAAIAVVFPALFALGVLLLAQYVPTGKDLDQDCVLYGEIALVGFDTMDFAGLVLIRPAVSLGIVLALNAVFIALLFKELKVATFDPGLAASLGISPILLHYLLMGSVSLTTVASFDAVGAILVVAFLIVPAATAYLLTDRLGIMLGLSVVFGVAASCAGYLVAQSIGDVSIAGCMAAAMGALFGIVWVFSPREGILGRWRRRRENTERFAQALVLARLVREPATTARVAEDLAWEADRVTGLCDVLAGNGLIESAGPTLRATRAGRGFLDAVVG